jgi:predicted ATPase/transcriptional regulator with XRE-family HTH domain
MAPLGDLVRGHRRALGLTQEELAGRAGLSERAVREIERGNKHTPRTDTVQLLADALELAGAQRDAFEAAAARAGRSDALLHRNGRLHPTNLPDESTPFIGREPEIARVSNLFDEPTVRLVTLTGTGGTGKTRLALRVAAALLPAFTDGVFFVSLASLNDPALVASSIAAALGAREGGETVFTDALACYLRDKRLLLLLDNAEHLLEASTLVERLLDACPLLHILVTSRTPLHLVREHEYAVAALTFPPTYARQPVGLRSLDELATYEALALFVARARAVKADFALTDENAPAVAEICRHLDGLPLAIELAAARIKLLPPQALLQRLSSRLQLLTGGARDHPARHRTLRASIDWSYSLLSEQERELFTELSVFARGCTLETAAAVCGAEGDLEIDLLDGVASLVEKSLLQQEGKDEPRFRMLETIREYAAERLGETEQREVVQRQHASYYLSLAEKVAPELFGPSQVEWLARLEEEHDNFRAALQWANERGELEMGLLLASALRQFWYLRGYWSEGSRWLQTYLTTDREAAHGVSEAVRARALQALGILTEEPERAVALLEESLALYRALGDKPGTGDVLVSLAVAACRRCDHIRAVTLSQESLSLGRELADKRVIASSLDNLGEAAYAQNDFTWRQNLFEESLRLHRDMGNKAGMTGALTRLAWGLSVEGDYERAEALFQECLPMCRELGDRWGIVQACHGLGHVARERGDFERARAFYGEGLAVSRQVEDTLASATALLALSDLARDQGDAERVTELGTESLALFRSLGDIMNVGYSLNNLGIAALQRGEYELAAALCSEACDLLQAARAEPAAVEILTSLGTIAEAQGDYDRAEASYAEALSMLLVSGFRVGRMGAMALEGMAGVAAAQRQPERAAHLFSAANALRTRIGAPICPANHAWHERQMAALGTALGDEALRAAWERGEAISAEQAINYALEEAALP